MWPFTRERSIPAPEPQAPPAPTEPPLLCSFCGKTQDEVRKLIAGPSGAVRGVPQRRELINVPRGVALCRDCFHAMRSLRNKSR